MQCRILEICKNSYVDLDKQWLIPYTSPLSVKIVDKTHLES